MSNSVVSIVYALSDPTFPAGTTIDHVAVSIADSSATPPVSVTQNVPAGTATVTFTNVLPGTYVATAQAEDASGAALGTAATATFTVTAPATISLSLPSAVTVAVT